MDSIHLQQTLPQVFADRNSITSDVWHRNLVFHKGKSYLIEAASGTGKSSLCSYIYGYRNDYQGIINFDETNIKATVYFKINNIFNILIRLIYL